MTSRLNKASKEGLVKMQRTSNQPRSYLDSKIQVTLTFLLFLQGECASANIQRLLMQQRIEARKPPIANPSALNPKSFVATSSTDLLNLVDADFALLSIDDKIRAIGMIGPYQEALAIMSYLQSCRFNTIRSSHNIKTDFPGFSYPPELNTIGGLLLVPLNVKDGNHMLVFFRETQKRHVNWAG
jgi:light-regulated signal transduction histidine kinase (bacteriophytochrome)